MKSLKAIVLFVSVFLALTLTMEASTVNTDAPKQKPAEADIYYARCNLKIIKGNCITWANWQSSPTFIPVGTKLKVVKSGKTASITNVETSSNYTLYIGAKENVFLKKFITKEPINVNLFPADVQFNIKNTTAETGMTKEQVYTAMGPPVGPKGARTNKMTYEDIMNTDLWVYAKRRSQSINVIFDRATNRVSRIEEI